MFYQARGSFITHGRRHFKGEPVTFIDSNGGIQKVYIEWIQEL
jgi:hypothetical protein